MALLFPLTSNCLLNLGSHYITFNNRKFRGTGEWLVFSSSFRKIWFLSKSKEKKKTKNMCSKGLGPAMIGECSKSKLYTFPSLESG